GAQTVFPGSTHESGEAIVWDHSGEPREIEGADLKRAVSVLAALSLLVRHWPGEGSRHEAALALGGFFARLGGDFASEGADLVAHVAGNAGDNECRDRRRAAADAIAE